MGTMSWLTYQRGCVVLAVVNGTLPVPVWTTDYAELCWVWDVSGVVAAKPDCAKLGLGIASRPASVGRGHGCAVDKEEADGQGRNAVGGDHGTRWAGQRVLAPGWLGMGLGLRM